VPLGVIAGVGAAIGGIGQLVGAFGGGSSGPSAGQVSSQQLQEQSAVFGEQQGFEAQLAALLKDPSSVTKLPGYQFNLEQGEGSLARQFIAAGYGGSGNMGAGLVKYGQDYASSAYQQQVQILSQLAGITAPSSPAALGGNALTGQSNQNQQMNNLLYQLGVLGGNQPYGGWNLFAAAGTPGSGGWTGGINPAWSGGQTPTITTSG
jgi:hypothetical protein